MKNINNIMYRGYVTVKEKKKDGMTLRVHNSGEQGILNFLTKALAGDESIEKYRPKKIMCFNDSTEILTSYLSMVTNPVKGNLNSTNVFTEATSTDFSAIQLQFIVSYLNLKSAESDTFNKICLYDTNNNICASVELESSITVSQGTDALIYWVLSLSNYSE